MEIIEWVFSLVASVVFLVLAGLVAATIVSFFGVLLIVAGVIFVVILVAAIIRDYWKTKRTQY